MAEEIGVEAETDKERDFERLELALKGKEKAKGD